MAKGLVVFNVAYQQAPVDLSALADHQLAPGSMLQGTPAQISYEELWYQNGNCVGAKRQTSLVLKEHSEGAVYFVALDSSIAAHAQETANAAVRLFMDIKLKSSIPAGLIVPEGSFEQVSSALSNLNFLPLEKTHPFQQQRLSLHLIAYPKGKDRYLFYDCHE